jgi:LacI family gluconate utilization system Gnt-I transcriptional repressor
MRDVARAADVSLITVVRALRSPDLVHPKTRQRIEEVIRDTGYVPNLMARSLQGSRSHIAAVLIPSLNNSMFAATAQAIADVSDRAGYQLMVGNLGDDRYEASEEKLVRAFLGRRPDGFILMAARHSAVSRDLLVKSGVPVVETWNLPAEPIDMVVGFSNFEAARALVHKIHALGYRRLALITGRYEGNQVSIDREQGYLSAVSELGLPRRPELIVEAPVPATLDSGAQAVARILDLKPAVDAVVCAGDTFAHGAMLECLRRGVSVPGRLAIAGIGDLDLSARLPPGLTTVRVYAQKIGHAAAKLLFDRLNGRRSSRRVIDVGFEIILRGST